MSDPRFFEVADSVKSKFVYRLVTGLLTVVCTGLVAATFTFAKDISKDITDLKLAIIRGDGRLDVVSIKVDAHNDRFRVIESRQDKFDERQNRFDERLVKGQSPSLTNSKEH